jgi:hypothetical protein
MSARLRQVTGVPFEERLLKPLQAGSAGARASVDVPDGYRSLTDQ